MKCPEDRKDTLNINVLQSTSLYVNITNCPGDLKDINVLLHYISNPYRVDIYMSLRSPGHFIPWRTLIFLSIFPTTILRF